MLVLALFGPQPSAVSAHSRVWASFVKNTEMKMSSSLLALLLVNVVLAYCKGERSVKWRGNRNIRSRFVQQVNDKNSDSNFVSPSFPPTSFIAPSVAPATVANPSPFVIELLEFTVSMEDSTHSQSVAKQLDTHLTSELTKTFSSLRSVDLMQTGTVTGLAALTVLAFSGTATFSGIVSAEKVREAQTQILQDSATVKKVAPKVVSISMLNPETQFSPAGLIVVVIVSTIGFVAALFFGYRRYKSKHAEASVEEGTEGDSARKEVSPQDGLSHSGLSFCRNTEIDDYSIDDFSTTAASEAGHNFNQRDKRQEMSEDDSSFGHASTADYDADHDVVQSHQRRYMHEDEYSVDVALSTDYDTDDDHSRMPVVMPVVNPRNARTVLQEKPGLLKSGMAKHFDDSEAEFSYSNVGNKGLESDDDDVYTTDNEGTAASIHGYVNMLGGKKDEDEDEYLEDEELAPSPFSRMQLSRPFDEVSVELPPDKDGNLERARNRSSKTTESVDVGRNGPRPFRRERRNGQH